MLTQKSDPYLMRRIFKYGAIQNMNLTPDRAEHFDILNAFIVELNGKYQGQISQVFCPPLPRKN